MWRRKKRRPVVTIATNTLGALLYRTYDTYKVEADPYFPCGVPNCYHVLATDRFPDAPVDAVPERDLSDEEIAVARLAGVLCLGKNDTNGR